jgi:hypothetical protein
MAQTPSKVETGQEDGRGERGTSLERQVRLGLTLRDFDLPPIGDGVVVGTRAPIGCHGLFESIDRMLPGQYELVAVSGNALVEGVILRRSRLKLIPRDRLAALFVGHAETMMTEASIVRVDVEAELRLRMDLE